MPKMHTPLPQELAEEFTKAASILEHFVKGTTQLDQALIPPHIIANAKGVAVLTIVKAGFIWSGRAGTGLVVARLADGRWSAPSAIAAGGAGVGAQIGAEVTDSVFILNSESAIKAFSHGGNVTFGANLSIAAGPVGRSAEGAGSVANMAPIYSYSKTKGLFAGVSFEGLVIITRKETNARFYGGLSGTATPQDLLSGRVAPPAEAEVLYRALNARGFGSNMDPGGAPQVPNGGSISSGLGHPMGASSSQQPYTSTKKQPPPPPPPHPTIRQIHSASTSQTFQPPPQAPPKPALLQKKQQPPSLPPHPVTSGTLPAYTAAAAPTSNNSTGKVPPRPSPTSIASANASQSRLIQQTPAQPPALPAKHPMSIKSVTALYDFDGQRAGDLSFITGDRILVLKDQGEWWEGELKGVRGVFPCNYVQ
ncbi:hypothetical protein BJ741DRAFT_655945 [Chytriomyces cf. hyalinus JEL632]|nr:hypothetical protein BJ741DRAFT_655945 [Chytriomyces cf. hyalinus JEL632]